MLIALGLAAVLSASDPEGVVVTAPVGSSAVATDAIAPTSDAALPRQVAVAPQDLTTSEQIDRWLAARSQEAPFPDADLVDDRRVHGFVSASIGTHDFSQVAVGVSLPVGESGRLDLSYSQTKNGWFGGPYGSIDHGLYALADEPWLQPGYQPIGLRTTSIDPWEQAAPGPRPEPSRSRSLRLRYTSDSD